MEAAGGSLVVAITGLAMVLLGVFQYLSSSTKRNDDSRKVLISQLEKKTLMLAKCRANYILLHEKNASLLRENKRLIEERDARLKRETEEAGKTK